MSEGNTDKRRAGALYAATAFVYDHSYPYTHLYVYTHAYTHTRANSDVYTHADSYLHRDNCAHADLHADPDCDTHDASDTYRYVYTRPDISFHRDAYPDAYTHRDACSADVHIYTGTYIYTYSHPRACYGYFYARSNGNPCINRDVDSLANSSRFFHPTMPKLGAGSTKLLWYNVRHPFNRLEEITRTVGSIPCAIWRRA